MKQKSPQSLLIVISAPSGAGKTTVCKLLAKRNAGLKLSVSATTRPPRKNEQNGVEYFFLTKEEFFKKIKDNHFIEYEEVHGNYYGTLKSAVQDLINNGFSVLLDIDVNGAVNIKKHFPQAILFFLRPPSQEELMRRLIDRRTDSKAEIKKRLKRIPQEYEKAPQFDYDIINDDLYKTVEEIERIISKHKDNI